MWDINILHVSRQQSVGPPAGVAGGEQLTVAAPPEDVPTGEYSIGRDPYGDCCGGSWI